MIGHYLAKHVSPHTRLVIACVIFDVSVVGWIATHILIFVTQPAESSWVFHLLLAISWIAITFTAFDAIQTSDVRKEQGT